MRRNDADLGRRQEPTRSRGRNEGCRGSHENTLNAPQTLNNDQNALKTLFIFY